MRNVLTVGKQRKENVCLQALIHPECVCLDRKGRMDVLELVSCMKLACKSSFLTTKLVGYPLRSLTWHISLSCVYV